MPLKPKPDFKAIEQKWQKYWADKNIYKFNPKSKKPLYTIDTPPPYLSGPPHMGHAVSYTGFEFMARYKRMSGHNVFFPIGFDDNGHPTERYVEKKYKVKSADMPREKFIALCLRETALLAKQAKEHFNKLGHSYDWNLFYSTIGPSAVKVAQQSFLDLYSKGLVYRTEQPALFCVHCQTALSQADVEDRANKTILNYIDFGIKGSKQKIRVATTRPELLPACVGLLVNPDDRRYKKFVGKLAVVPLFGHEVPVIADPLVQMKFGTGAVMVCTFGDRTDYAWWKSYKLPLRVVLTKDGKLNENAGRFAGLEIRKARQKIIEELKRQKLLRKQEPLEQVVGVCWRCKRPVEFLPTKQWAVRILQFKKDLLRMGRKVAWHPAYYRARYEDWVRGLSWDWVISRQRYYGVPMPVWYCKACGREIVADEKQLPVYPAKDKPKAKCCGKKQFLPELDVFDTWMTSSMTPQITRGFGKDSIPFDLRPQGYEIIRTWAFYTLLKSLYHFKSAPWKHILINGLILDPKGKAMHKSLGNVIEPMAVVEKFGADALRYFASAVNVGEDAPFQEKELIRAQKLMIKLWNVARFVEMWKPKKTKYTNIVDSWIISRLSEIIKLYKENFENYNPVGARRILENFFWHEYCDFYLEMAKHRLYGKNKKEKESAEQTLYSTFYKILQMLAVFLPHITEEIYHELFKDKERSIHLTQLPEYKPVDTEALKLGSIAVEILAAIRKYKASLGKGPGAELGKLTVAHPDKKAQLIKGEIEKIARIKNLEIRKGSLKISA